MEDPARLDRAPCANVRGCNDPPMPVNRRRGLTSARRPMLIVRMWDKLTILIEKWLLNPGRTSTPVHRESLLEPP